LSTIEVREHPAQPTASVRLRGPAHKLDDAFDRYLPLVAARVGQLGAAMVGPPFARYHAMNGTEFDVEIGVPLARPIVGQHALRDAEPGEVARSELPACRAATMICSGPYDGLGRAWDELQAWVTREGYAPAAPGWESYVDDPRQVPAQQLRTALFVPVG